MPMERTMGAVLSVYPVGMRCNLACAYCGCIHGEVMPDSLQPMVMRESVLKSLMRQAYAAQRSGFHFHWRGGEPLLSGIPFFQKAYTLQRLYGLGRRPSNTIHTNGMLLSDEWCSFLAQNQFSVHIALDGPKEFHDSARHDVQGQPSFERVQRGLLLLQKHGVRYSIGAVLHAYNVRYPHEIYEFLRELGATFIDIQPLLPEDATGARYAGGVDPMEYADFYLTVFSDWLQQDLGRVHIRLFDALLAQRLALPDELCDIQSHCGVQIAVDAMGNVFPCARRMDAQQSLGNLSTQSMKTMLEKNAAISPAKQRKLPEHCMQCPMLSICHGGCLVQRRHAGKRPHALCEGYQKFYSMTQPYIQHLAALQQQGKTVEEIRQAMHLE